MSQSFDISQAFSDSWQTFKKNWELILAIIIANSLLGLGLRASSNPASWIPKELIVFLFLIVLVSWLVSFAIKTFIDAGRTKIYLKITRKKKAEFMDLFSQRRTLPKLVSANLLISLVKLLATGIIILLPASIYFLSIDTSNMRYFGDFVSKFVNNDTFWVLLILSLLAFLVAIYFSIRIQYTLTLIIDYDLGIYDAVLKSLMLTKGQELKLILLWFSLLLLNVLGFFALIVGLLVTIPLSNLIRIHVYDQLVRAKFSVPE